MQLLRKYIDISRNFFTWSYDKYLLEKQHVRTAFLIFGGKYDIKMVDKNAPINYESGFITGCKDGIAR
uniref:Uncharacterized protein n=1 Tax=Rhizophagus irregularis (strain DAOM 181602 / DAOM 197198 / MUCL 43194) TaxID=747089 RepID=U9UJP8_RHIID